MRMHGLRFSPFFSRKKKPKQSGLDDDGHDDAHCQGTHDVHFQKMHIYTLIIASCNN